MADDGVNSKLKDALRVTQHIRLGLEVRQRKDRPEAAGKKGTEGLVWPPFLPQMPVPIMPPPVSGHFPLTTDISHFWVTWPAGKAIKQQRGGEM